MVCRYEGIRRRPTDGSSSAENLEPCRRRLDVPVVAVTLRVVCGGRAAAVYMDRDPVIVPRSTRALHKLTISKVAAISGVNSAVRV